MHESGGMRWGAAVAATAIAALLGSAPGARAQLASSAWPMFQHDARHTGQSQLLGPDRPRVKWTYKGRNRLVSAPSVGADGTVYVGNGKAPLCAIDPGDGGEIWCTTEGRGGDAAQSSPAVHADGRIFMGARDNDLWAVEPDGDIQWRYSVDFDGDVTTPPTIGSNGTIYMASNALGLGWLFAMRGDGSVKWKYENRIGILNASPAIGPDGNLVVGLTASTVRKLTPAGELLWSTRVAQRNNTRRQPNQSPSIAADGTVYFGAANGLWALDGATGEVAWHFPTSGWVEAAPSIAADGTVYVSSTSPRQGGRFYALTPQGSLKWSFATPDDFTNCQAAIGADGKVYVPSGDTLYALSSTGARLWQHSTERGKFLSGPVIGAPGVLYIASTDNNLYAIGR